MARVRNIHGGTEKRTQVCTTDKISRTCHAYHHYEIHVIGSTGGPVAEINFQNGPVGEVGANGCSNEDLLAIVIDRLECLDAGKFPCEENKSALSHARLALTRLNDRTFNREKRGVEGRNKA